MKNIYLILFSAVFMLLGNTAVLAAGLPETAAIIGLELDAQLAERLGEGAPVQGQTIIMTVPADLNNLEVTNPLSRQLAEDLASWFVKAGYSLQEIRKGRDVLFMPHGETMLTRNTDQLGERRVQSALILVGTYVKTRANMRFNLRLLHAGTNEVLAMTSRSLSLDPEIVDLLMDDDSSVAMTPSVSTSISASAGPRMVYRPVYQQASAARPILPKSTSPVYIPPVN